MKILLPVVLIALLSACGESSDASCGVYAIGPNQIKEILKSQQAEPAPGRTAKADLPADFPADLLDTQGFYRGMAVYCTVDEARKAITEQKHADWSVYELSSEWASNVYKADDGANHLSQNSTIKQAVE